MNAWVVWARKNERALIDPGAPLFRKKRVMAREVEDFTDSKTGYTIVEAERHEGAARLFTDHPHVALLLGHSIEVSECLPVPS
ncbi:hypothetical protein ACWD4K_25590 [Streptomyces gelaticus]